MDECKLVTSRFPGKCHHIFCNTKYHMSHVRMKLGLSQKKSVCVCVCVEGGGGGL